MYLSLLFIFLTSLHALRIVTTNTLDTRALPLSNLYLVNSCNTTLYFKTVGAYPVSANRDEDEHELLPHHIYSEPLRETVFHNCSSTNTSCNPLGKVFGQSPVIKITNSLRNYSYNVFQVLYTIGDGGAVSDNLRYDVSVVNCAGNVSPTAHSTGTANPVDQLQRQIESCPGYQGGVAIWTNEASICPPVYCNGTQLCSNVYDNETAAMGKATKGCSKQYRGELRVELCAANGNGYARVIYEKWLKQQNVIGTAS